MFHPTKIPQKLMHKYVNWEQTPGGILNELAQLLKLKIEYEGVDARTSQCPGPQNIAGKQNDMFGIRVFIGYEDRKYKIAFPVVRSLNKKGARSEAQAAACKLILGERDVQNKTEQPL